MIDIQKEYKVLLNHFNRYKTKVLGFECGCVVGYVTEINLIQDPESNYPWDKAIQVRGIAGMDDKERELMVITEKMKKGKDYKYCYQYHILEFSPRALW